MPIINRGKHCVTERTFKEIAGIGVRFLRLGLLPSNEASRGSLYRRTTAVTVLLMFRCFAKFELVSDQKRWTSFLRLNERE